MTLVMNVPEKLSGDVEKTRFMLVISLFEKRKLSLSEASEMCNVDSKEFMNKKTDYNDGIIFG
ncbi:MAG: putative HTH domain antitoxin [Glaciecola sp.]|jgi:predicted HTH domain antitoxin